MTEGDTLHVAVADSGDGVRPEDAERLFHRGFTTRGPEEATGHGLGLALARQIVAKRGGELRVGQFGGTGHGAVFSARIPGVLRRPLPPGPESGHPNDPKGER